MRIVHVITRLIVGGAQENTILTCRGLAEKGHDVTLIAGPETGPEGSLWPQTQNAGFEVLTLPSLRRAVRPTLDLRARRELRRIFERLRPDVVHTHSSKAGILGRSAAALAKVPCIVHTIHGMSFNRTQGRTTQLFFRALERRAARQTTAFITVADAMIDQSAAAGIAPRDRFTTIRSGIVTDDYVPDRAARERQRKEWGLEEDEVVVGTIARLFDEKGYDAIIAAMPSAVAREPGLRFVWVGDGPLRADYERRLSLMGMRDRVRLVGLVDPHQVPRLVNAFDMVVHASRWEGLPRALVQALLLERPVISFDVDGAPEIVMHEKTGLLVPLDDTAALADAVVRLGGDPARRDSMGRAGRQHCLHEFDWRFMVDQIDQLYRDFLLVRLQT